MYFTLGSAGSYLCDAALGLLLKSVDAPSVGLDVGVCLLNLSA